jgi:hypothetical protein
MIRRGVRAAIAAAALCVPVAAAAQVTPAAGYTPPDDTQAIRIGAVIFWDYTYQNQPKITDAGGNSVHLNAFDVKRTYINVTGNISHVVSFRITPDISPDATTGSSLLGSRIFRLKYGYVNLALDDWMWRGSYVRLGAQQTLFIDSQEGIYRYRWQGTVFAERDGGLSSSDFGAVFRTQFKGNYGDVAVGVYNGEGYSRTEPNNQKAVELRGTIRPLPNANGILRNLRFTGFMHQDAVFKDAERNRYLFSAMVEHRRFNANFDWLSKKDQTSATAAEVNADGWSFFVTPFFKEKGNGLEALIRYDSLRPNKTVTDGRQNRWIAGLAYWFAHPGGNATAAVMLDYEQVAFTNIANQPKQQRVFVHGLINF